MLAKRQIIKQAAQRSGILRTSEDRILAYRNSHKFRVGLLRAIESFSEFKNCLHDTVGYMVYLMVLLPGFLG